MTDLILLHEIKVWICKFCIRGISIKKFWRRNMVQNKVCIFDSNFKIKNLKTLKKFNKEKKPALS